MSTSKARPSAHGVGAVLQLALLIACAMLALFVTARAEEPLMRFHGWLFFQGLLVWLMGFTVAFATRAHVLDEKRYEDGLIMAGAGAAVAWGIAGLLIGIGLAALDTGLAAILRWEGIDFATFRPLLHSLVILAVGGNALIATSYYVVQRACRARLAGGLWPWFVFWGYQLFITLAAAGAAADLARARQAAGHEWYVDLWLMLVWLVYLMVFLGTVRKRKPSMESPAVASGPLAAGASIRASWPSAS